MAKANTAAKKKFEFDAAGWLFWLVVFVVLGAPSIYLTWTYLDKDAGAAVRIGSGIVMAAIGAGIVSWAVNSVIQRRRKKERLAQRRIAKKQR